MATKQMEPIMQLATRVPSSLFRRVKVFCVENETAMQSFVAEALRESLRRSRPVRKEDR
jgi:hypothetical protein